MSWARSMSLRASTAGEYAVTAECVCVCVCECVHVCVCASV